MRAKVSTEDVSFKEGGGKKKIRAKTQGIWEPVPGTRGSKRERVESWLGPRRSLHVWGLWSWRSKGHSDVLGGVSPEIKWCSCVWNQWRCHAHKPVLKREHEVLNACLRGNEKHCWEFKGGIKEWGFGVLTTKGWLAIESLLPRKGLECPILPIWHPLQREAFARHKQVGSSQK